MNGEEFCKVLVFTVIGRMCYNLNHGIFLCQLYCDEEILSIKGTLCIQIYQWVDRGEEGADCIVVTGFMRTK